MSSPESHANPLVVDHVSIHFGGLRAVQDVSFTMEPGERRALIGPNGAGKTTLFNMISGQLTPTSGRISMHGRDVTRLAPFERARLGLGRTFQITNLFPNLTVEENLRLAVQALQPTSMVMTRPITSYPGVMERTRQMLVQWHLWEVRNEQARELSYGDQRELEILMALAGSPTLLLLDEPTAGLAPAETHLVTEVVQSLDPSITILLIEHDLDVAFQLANRVTVLHQGGILVDGTPEQVKADPRVKEIYLGTPVEKGTEPIVSGPRSATV